MNIRRISRFFSILIFSLFLSSFFLISGCSQKNGKDDVLTLKVWETYKFEEHTLFLKFIKKFEKQYQAKHGKAIHIIANRVPFDNMINNLKMSSSTRATPDIARVDALKVLELAYHKTLVPLDLLPAFKKDFKTIQGAAKEYVPAAFGSNVVDIQGTRHLYGLPEQTTTVCLFWNKKIFRHNAAALKKAGLDPKRAPKTWTEFIKYAKVLTHPKNGIYGFAMNNSLWWTFPFFNTYNTKFIDIAPDGKMKCILNNPNARQALQLKVDLYRKYKVEAGAWQSGATGPDQGFINEKYAMILMGPWLLDEFKKSNIDFGVAPIPSGSVPSSSNVGGNNIVIFRTAKQNGFWKGDKDFDKPDEKLEAAYEFIRFITGTEMQIKWCGKLGQIPINIQAMKQLKKEHIFDSKPNLRVFIKQIKSSRPIPQMPLYGMVEDKLNAEMDLALQGTKSVEQALQSAQDKINRDVLNKVNNALDE